jgi:heme/copper-type cytochrome/quinol oxidase subunit 2
MVNSETIKNGLSKLLVFIIFILIFSVPIYCVIALVDRGSSEPPISTQKRLNISIISGTVIFLILISIALLNNKNNSSIGL